MAQQLEFVFLPQVGVGLTRHPTYTRSPDPRRPGYYMTTYLHEDGTLAGHVFEYPDGTFDVSVRHGYILRSHTGDGTKAGPWIRGLHSYEQAEAVLSEHADAALARSDLIWSTERTKKNVAIAKANGWWRSK